MSHYRGKIQPIDFIEDQGMNFYEGNIVKYVARYKFKGTPEQDLIKARDYLDRLLCVVRSQNSCDGTLQQ